MPRYVRSKWNKTEALLKAVELYDYIPQTNWMTSESLQLMLYEHTIVYIKPNVGTYGNGVMRVEWNSEVTSKGYSYQIGVRKLRFDTFEEMFLDIKKRTGQRLYLVQKGIHLLKYHNRRFDIRVMVQQNLKKKWVASGLIGRVAHPRKIVTNYHSGGTPKSVHLLLTSHLGNLEKQQYIRKLKRLGTKVAKQMQESFPEVVGIGIDVAIDNELKPWILEVNTKPDLFIFKKLHDKSVYRKIIRYASIYRKNKVHRN